MKFPINDCYGFLLGSKKENNVEVADAIPLTHESIFSTNFEVSLKLIDKFYIKKNQNIKIVGFYENLMLNQMKSDLDISVQTKQVIELINKNSVQGPVLFEIASRDKEGSKEINRVDDIIFLQYMFNKKEGFDQLGEHEETNEEFEKLKKYVSKNMQNDIVDFDDHFEDPNLDWKNSFIQ